MSTYRLPACMLGNPDRTAGPGEVNHHVVDRFTFAHYAVGVCIGAARLPWWGALLLAVGWEVVERPLKRTVPGAFPHSSQDTLANAAGDTTAVMAGWLSWKGVERIGNR